MSETYKEIAPRLVGIRDALDLTVEELAEKIGSDVEKVALYESGTVEIPVGYLLDVSRACGVDLTTLISGTEPRLSGYALIRKGEGMEVDRRKDYDYRSLGYKFAGRNMEPFLIRVPPKAGSEMHATAHKGQEFIYMLEGRLELKIDNEPLIMEPGDSIYFDSSRPHALRGLDGEDAVFLDVIL